MKAANSETCFGKRGERHQAIIEHNLFSYPYSFFTNVQFPLLKVVVLYFDKLAMLEIQRGDMLLLSRLSHMGYKDLKSLRRTRWIIPMKIIQPTTKLKF